MKKNFDIVANQKMYINFKRLLLYYIINGKLIYELLKSKDI